MSKASEWAREASKTRREGVACPPRPEFRMDRSRTERGSFPTGYLGLLTRARPILFLAQSAMSPRQACALAHWILDTFGESA